MVAAFVALAVGAVVLPAAVPHGGDRVRPAGHGAPLARDGGHAHSDGSQDSGNSDHSDYVDDDAAPQDCTSPEASLRPSGASGPAVKRIRAKGFLVAGVDQNSYRWGYRDPATGRLGGFDIDLVRAIAANILGDPDKVVYRAIPTSRRVPALRQRTVDVVVRTTTINCARARQVAFSTAYFQAGQQVLAARNSPITGYNETLRDRRVCIAKGSTAQAELAKKSYGARLLPPVPNQLDCLVRLQLGQADAVITDNALAAGQAAQDPSVELKGSPFTDELYGVAMNQDDTDLVRRVNKVLDDYRAGGKHSRWKRAYDTWLAKDLGKGNAAPPKPKYQH
ncbi:sugar-binding protein [Streptomyces albus subsp. albus]|nr:sugar-binding protein [Streptomyces albus subsp. albus]